MTWNVIKAKGSERKNLMHVKSRHEHEEKLMIRVESSSEKCFPFQNLLPLPWLGTPALACLLIESINQPQLVDVSHQWNFNKHQMVRRVDKGWQMTENYVKHFRKLEKQAVAQGKSCNFKTNARNHWSESLSDCTSSSPSHFCFMANSTYKCQEGSWIKPDAFTSVTDTSTVGLPSRRHQVSLNCTKFSRSRYFPMRVKLLGNPYSVRFNFPFFGEQDS